MHQRMCCRRTRVVRLVTVKVTRMVGWVELRADPSAVAGAWLALTLTRGRVGDVCSLLSSCWATELAGLLHTTLLFGMLQWFLANLSCGGRVLAECLQLQECVRWILTG